jgi:hypothetical protein
MKDLEAPATVSYKALFKGLQASINDENNIVDYASSLDLMRLLAMKQALVENDARHQVTVLIFDYGDDEPDRHIW